MNGKINDMTICGGGASSALWLRMLTGIYPSVEAACERLITVKQTLAPDAEAGEKYDAVYARYSALYPILKESYKALAALNV